MSVYTYQKLLHQRTGLAINNQVYTIFAAVCDLLTYYFFLYFQGMLISLNEVAITAGFLVAYLVGMICNSYSNGWRFMFGFGAVPALCQLFGMIKLPNSPHYLILKHRDQEAEDAVKQLRQLSSPNEIRQELTHIRLSMEAGRSQSCLSLCSSADGLRSAMLIAFGLVMSQQFTGQSNVLSYATTIFQQVGFCGDDALPTVGLGIVKVTHLICILDCRFLCNYD